MASDQEQNPTPVFLTVKDVCNRYRVSASSVWSWTKSGAKGFPKPVAIGARATRWHLEDLVEWENSQRYAA